MTTYRVIDNPSGDRRALRRFEDPRLLTGAAQFVDDLVPAGSLVLYVVRSPHAHAEIVAVSTGGAAKVDGVLGVFTATDLAADGLGSLPCNLVFNTGGKPYVPPRLPLAVDRVRHVGDPVAFLVAESLYAAAEAAELVDVDYETLPAVVSSEAAIHKSAAQIWAEAPGNRAYRFRKGDFEATEAALQAADHVVMLDLVNNRLCPAPIEPRCAFATWDAASDSYELVASASSVHKIRNELAEGVLRIPPDRLRVRAPEVGGGFGIKNIPYPEYAMLLWAARRFERPIHWSADRIEDFATAAHGRANVTTARLGLNREGQFVALQVETLADLGAYVSSNGPGSSTNAPSTAMGGLYDIPAISMDVTGVFTNTTPVDAYRGAGKPEANYIIERLIDVAAADLGMNRIDLRRHNLIATFPNRTALGQQIDSGDFRGNLERALEAADFVGTDARKAEARTRGMLRGIGIGCFLETARGQPREEAWVRFGNDEKIELALGTHSIGQGHETSFAQLAAEHLSLPLEAFRLVHGDTATVPRGGGHGGARSLHMGGTALVLAVEDVLAKAQPIAARLLQLPADEVTYSEGAFRSLRGEGQAVDLLAVAWASREMAGEGPLQGHGDNRSDIFTYPNGCHVAEVEIDPATGRTTLESYLAVDDYGTLVNPLLTEGQVHGGLAQGIGQALMEGVVYDSQSGELLSASFMDYTLPRGDNLPSFDIRFVEIPTMANPIGSKGAGQAGTIGAPQTVMNAVMDALAPLGIRHVDMPATPSRVFGAIADTHSTSGKV
ncbi:MAG: xanthine dehydrogenase family protein molybdopterin-binding subunit [Paracoccaceae bacterium]|nr:xanthine dehydrogenase family protein molybdopterin-binding subunit [Paracoccaceae bacterium]